MVRANKFQQTCRGIGDGMQAKGTIRNTGSPSGDRDVDQLAARERRARLTGMAERPVVLTKPGNSGGGNPFDHPKRSGDVTKVFLIVQTPALRRR
jgi:hypothetical protein